MKKLCPECGSTMSRSHCGKEGNVDATPPFYDAPSHDDEEANRTAAAAPPDGGGAGGALEAAAAVVVASAGTGGSVGTLAATARQERQLLEWAEKTGRLIPEEAWPRHRLICASTAEHEVRHRNTDNRALKRTHLGTYGFIPRQTDGLWKPFPATPSEYLQRWILQNRLFGDDIQLEGVIVSSGPSLIIGQPAGGISLVISQPWLDALDSRWPHPGDSEIASLMDDLGFEPIHQAFYGWRSRDGNFVILDAKPDNFVVTATDILPIDLQLVCVHVFSIPPQSQPADRNKAEASSSWRCVNPDCPTEVRARLARWCAPEAMDIAGADEKLIAQFVAHGLVLDVADFYRLKFGELMELEGMTEATAKDFLAAITASKTRDWWRVLAGLGIPQVDAGVAQSLARTFKNLDDLAGAPLARLTAQAGPAVAQSMANWFGERQNRKLIQRLGKAGLF